MYKLRPFVSEKIWGYERWIVSTHPAGQSLAEGAGNDGTAVPLADAIGSYPLLIKVIQADQTLSVQVHPDDAYARVHERSLGKTECWYVLDAAPGTSLICGLTGTYTAQELRSAIAENRLEPYLRSVPVSKGDFIFIPAGLVHAINGGLRLLEVQESSDITYRLYDWGRGREVHVEKGLSVTKDLSSEPVNDFTGPFSCDYFSLERIDAGSGDVTVSCAENDFILFVLSEGGALACAGNRASCKAEDTFFCRAGETVAVSAGMSVMKIAAR